MELLGLFANQAAIALDLLQRSRARQGGARAGSGDVAVVARLAAALDGSRMRIARRASAARGAGGRSAQMKGRLAAPFETCVRF
jgi:hypothetical protein